RARGGPPLKQAAGSPAPAPGTLRACLASNLGLPARGFPEPSDGRAVVRLAAGEFSDGLVNSFRLLSTSYVFALPHTQRRPVRPAAHVARPSSRRRTFGSGSACPGRSSEAEAGFGQPRSAVMTPAAF